MKKGSLLLWFVVLLTVLTISACKPKEEPVYIEGTERKEIVSKAQPKAELILDGIARNDYATFINYFDPAMLKAMTEEQFATIVKLYGKLGQPTSLKLLNVVDKVDYYGINFEVTYPKQVVLMLVVLPKTEPQLVSGLWFK